ncbi:MAG: hypothetical protein ACRD26_23630 [Vicinamibacterales bacterium]
MIDDDDLSAAARSLHREWESPHLWPAIAAGIAVGAPVAGPRTRQPRPWHAWAAAALLVLGTGAATFVIRDRLAGDDLSAPLAPRTAERLLSDEALREIERAEARYIAAIDALATKAAATEASVSPLIANLRERLLVIDAAIADCHAEIERNRHHTHLRRQLLSIYQEKRRTLEQILDEGQHAS